MIRLRDLRPGDEANLWAVTVATTESTFRGLVPDDVYQRMCARVRDRNPSLTWLSAPEHIGLVAETGEGRIVGYASAGRPRSDPPGWDRELFLLRIFKEFQRQGIGRRLLQEDAAHYARAGYRNLVVWSLASNRPSRRFYEALGAKMV